MKKLLVLILALILALTAASCKSEKEESQTPAVKESAVQETSDMQQMSGENDEVSESADAIGGAVTLEELMNAAPTSAEELHLTSSAESEYQVSKYYGSNPILALPDTYQNEPITKIAKYALANDSGVAALRINDSCRELEEYSCASNESLKVVVFGAGVKYVCEGAFKSCSNLETVILNEGLEKLEMRAFSGCTSLKSITIPASVTSIDQLAFWAGHDDFTIYGEVGSYAETFAAENDIPFVAQ